MLLEGYFPGKKLGEHASARVPPHYNHGQGLRVVGDRSPLVVGCDIEFDAVTDDVDAPR